MKKSVNVNLRLLLFASCMLFIQLTNGQPQNLQGKVVTSTGEAVPGATVVVEGTNVGTITDVEGMFSVSIGNNSMIKVTFIGLETQVVDVSGVSSVTVTMKEDTKLLDDVIVTGYTTQKKADITGAVAPVDMGVVSNQPSANVVSALQGRVAGMKITNDGSPSGGNAKIQIRGIGTLNSTDPLYIIDGVPTKSGLQELNSADIESIQVLKDAASASIYGSRASNGVIVITTKQGKEGMLKVNMNAYGSASFFNKRQDALNAQEYGRAMWTAMTNDGFDPNSNGYSYQFDWHVAEDGKSVLDKIIIPEYLDAGKTIRSADTDWFDEITGVGIAQNYDISVSNGNDRGKYLFSLGYYDNEGIINTSEFNRISLRMNTDFNVIKNILTIGENFSINKTSEITAPSGAIGNALRAVPIIPVRTVDGEGWGGPIGGMNDRQNPVRELEYNKDNGNEYTRFLGNIYVELKPIKNLVLRTNIGIDNSFRYTRNLQKSYISGYLQNEQTSVQMVNTRNERLTWSNTAIYKLDIKRHSLNVLVGTELYKDYSDWNGLRKEDFIIETPEYMYPDAGTGAALAWGNASEYRLMSFFGKVDYDFDNKYLASVTIRRDGSSRFGENNRYGTFPAFSLGWRMSQESFIVDNANAISDMKFRFSWGETGNQEIDNNAIHNIYRASYADTSYDIYGNDTGLLPPGYMLDQRANSNIKWEATTQTNFGFDYGFWDQSLYGSIDYYIKNTSDILVKPAYLGALGEGGGMWQNGASMENKGWELSLGYSNKTNWGLEYNIGANWSKNSNKITELPQAVINNYGGNGLEDNILGRPINSSYGFVADGLFRSQAEVDSHAEQQGKGLGRIRYKDLDGSTVVDNGDRTWIQNPHPRFEYGLNIDLKYKGFDLAIFFDGLGRVEVVNSLRRSSDFWGVEDVGSNKGTRLLDAWSPFNPDSDIPALSSVNNNDEGRASTYFVENGAYLKLRNLQLGYTLPQSLVQSIQISSLRVYLSGQNLVTFKSKNFSGFDPEVLGWEGYPIPLVVTAGLSITL
ncbi:MAG: SusC/RagA family TonB-linked outer membrane protein [Bacteroides xylanisolvens]